MERLAQWQSLVAAKRLCAQGLSPARHFPRPVQTLTGLGAEERRGMWPPALYAFGKFARAQFLPTIGHEAHPVRSVRNGIGPGLNRHATPSDKTWFGGCGVCRLDRVDSRVGRRAGHC